MKILVDVLIIIGAVIAVLGVLTKLSGISIIAPMFNSAINHIIVANLLLLSALIIDFKSKSK